MKVLYVEDDPHDADLTIRTLARSAPHIAFETVSGIGEAHARLARIASEPIDLVLTDMHLRDGDGLSFLNHIRENSVPVAVVIVTGVGDEETAVAALKARESVSLDPDSPEPTPALDRALRVGHLPPALRKYYS